MLRLTTNLINDHVFDGTLDAIETLEDLLMYLSDEQVKSFYEQIIQPKIEDKL